MGRSAEERKTREKTAVQLPGPPAGVTSPGTSRATRSPSTLHRLSLDPYGTEHAPAHLGWKPPRTQDHPKCTPRNRCISAPLESNPSLVREEMLHGESNDMVGRCPDSEHPAVAAADGGGSVGMRNVSVSELGELPVRTRGDAIREEDCVVSKNCTFQTLGSLPPSHLGAIPDSWRTVRP